MGYAPTFNITIFDIFFYAYIALVIYAIITVIPTARSAKEFIVSILCTPVYALIMVVWYLVSIVYIAVLLIKYIVFLIIGIISLILTLTFAMICEVVRGIIDIPVEGGETCKDFVDDLLNRNNFNKEEK